MKKNKWVIVATSETIVLEGYTKEFLESLTEGKAYTTDKETQCIILKSHIK